MMKRPRRRDRKRGWMVSNSNKYEPQLIGILEVSSSRDEEDSEILAASGDEEEGITEIYQDDDD
eukprot:scaffold30717_cov76-Amphora_coffeaeformis.AAC.1